MHSFQRGGRAVVLAAGSALALACSSTEAVRPASLSIVSGESQSGLVGALMTDSLVVLVTGSDGKAFAGATVTWAVATGSATMTPVASTSNASGQAASAVNLGLTTGAVTVTATVSGVTPVTFHLTSVTACDWRAPFAVTATVSGVLGSNDCLLSDGSYIDYYGLSVGTQQAARIGLVAGFDAFLMLNDASGIPVGADDDGGVGTNSELLVIMAPGSYAVGANSYSSATTGPYTLTSGAIAESISGCENWYATAGIATSQQLLASDCSSSGYYADGVGVYLRSGKTYTITQNSTAFDAYLYLADNFGNLVASDDDGGGGNNARIVYSPGSSGLYIIFAGSFAAGETGAYTLAISAPVAAAGATGPERGVVPKLRRRGASWPRIAVIGVPRAPKQVP